MSSWETFHRLSSQSVAKWTRDVNLTIFNIERQPFLSSSEGLENWLGIETQGAIYVFLDHTQLVVTPIQWGFKQRFIYSSTCLQIFGWILKIFWPDFWRHFDWIFDGFFKILWPVTVEVNIGKCPAVFPTERFLKSTLDEQSTHTYTYYKLFPQFYY